MTDKSTRVRFEASEDFRRWLEVNCQTSDGLWLEFGKKGGPKTLTANDALEEALCYGWIDGQMQSIDDKTYIKYFAPRRKKSVWSPKNIAAVEELIKRGRMTEYGQAKIDEAKANGLWDATPRAAVTDADIETLLDKLKGHEPAYSNYMAMTPSVRRTYAGAYRAAASEESRARRLEQLLYRLNKNLKPMDRDA